MGADPAVAPVLLSQPGDRVAGLEQIEEPWDQRFPIISALGPTAPDADVASAPALEPNAGAGRGARRGRGDDDLAERLPAGLRAHRVDGVVQVVTLLDGWDQGAGSGGFRHIIHVSKGT